MSEKYLVTGACGFVGSHMVELLKSEGEDFRATDLAGADRSFVDSMGAEFVPADITRKETLKAAFEGIDYVFSIGALLDFASPWSTLEKVNVCQPAPAPFATDTVSDTDTAESGSLLVSSHNSARYVVSPAPFSSM